MNTLGYLPQREPQPQPQVYYKEDCFDCLNAFVFVSQAASVAFQNSRLLPLVTLLGAPS